MFAIHKIRLCCAPGVLLVICASGVASAQWVDSGITEPSKSVRYSSSLFSSDIVASIKNHRDNQSGTLLQESVTQKTRSVPSNSLPTAGVSATEDLAETDQLNAFVQTAPISSETTSNDSLGNVSSNVYSLEQLQSMAVANNPTINAAAFEMQRICGLRTQATLQPNPTLGYFGSQLADQGTDQHGIFIERQLVRGGKLELNDQVFDRSLQVSQHQMNLVQQKVMTDVQRLYYQAAAAQFKMQLINDFMKVADRGVQVAQDRKEAEEASQIEVLQAQTLQSEVRMSLKQAEAHFQGIRGRLGTLVGLEGASGFYVVADLPRIQSAPEWQAQLQQLIAVSPEMAVAQAALCEAEALLQRQQIQATPNITAQLGAGVDNATNSGMINLQFSAPIPVRNRNQGNIAAAQAAYHKAAAEVERVRQSIAARLASLSGEYESALASVQNLTEDILPQINETLELSEKAYVAGELDFLQVAVIRKSLYESQIRWIDARLDLSQAQARLDGLLLEGAWESAASYGIDGLRDQALGGE